MCCVIFFIKKNKIILYKIMCYIHCYTLTYPKNTCIKDIKAFHINEQLLPIYISVFVNKKNNSLSDV